MLYNPLTKEKIMGWELLYLAALAMQFCGCLCITKGVFILLEIIKSVFSSKTSLDNS
jgi:hypothetical protein